MKNIILVLIFASLLSCKQEKESQITSKTGTYSGIFKHGNFSDKISIDIEQDSTGYNVLFTSLEQNANTIPFRGVQQSGDSINFLLQSDFFTYDFKTKWTDNNNKLEGVLNIDTLSVPFTLNKELNNGETRAKSEELSFTSNGLNINGTIWHPKSKSDKAIVLLTSSGNADRSASRAEAVLFAQHGFTVFHYDKQGTGATEGNWQTATMEELLSDDMNAINYFSTKTGIPLGQIGITGSSQGGTKVPYILNELKQLKYGISVSCPGVSLYESDLNYWKNRNAVALGENLEEAAALQEKVFELIAGTRTLKSFKEAMKKEESKSWFSQIWIPNLDEIQIDTKLLFSPIPYFEKTQQPVLVIQGTLDEIIPKNSHLIIASALDKAENTNYKTLLLNGANHSMYNVGQSDFPYWSKLHSEYFKSIEEWISLL